MSIILSDTLQMSIKYVDMLDEENDIAITKIVIFKSHFENLEIKINMKV